MRKTDFTEEIAAEICGRIAEGQSLAQICRDEEMPGYRTVFQWLRAHEAFAQDYARAREAQGDADADAVTDIAWRTLAGEFDPSSARVAIDALKWTAGKRKPKVYGEKLDIDHSSTDGTMTPVSAFEVTIARAPQSNAD